MKRILRGSTLASCIVAAVWMASLGPTLHNSAYAQRTVMRGQNVVYYDGYGQGYYGVYVPSQGATYVRVPNNGYSGYGNGPYGNYPNYGNYTNYGNYPNYTNYGNAGYYGPFGGRTFGPSAYRVSPYGYYRGF